MNNMMFRRIHPLHQGASVVDERGTGQAAGDEVEAGLGQGGGLSATGC